MSLTSTGRRPTGLLLAVVGLAVVVGASLSPLADASPVERLRGRIAEASPPERFAYTYRRAGTRVLDCVLANTRYVGEVDRAAGTLVIRLAADGEPVAVLTAGSLLLHRSLFTDPPFSTPWLKLPRRPHVPAAAPLRRALGDLAGDLLAAGLPSSGEELVLAALEVATRVDDVGPADIAGQQADQFRINVDARRYASAAPSSMTGRAADEEAPIPVIDVWMTRGRVVRVAISSTRPDGSRGVSEDGWTIEYRRRDRPIVAPTPAGPDITASATADLALTPRRRDCRLAS